MLCFVSKIFSYNFHEPNDTLKYSSVNSSVTECQESIYNLYELYNRFKLLNYGIQRNSDGLEV